MTSNMKRSSRLLAAAGVCLTMTLGSAVSHAQDASARVYAVKVTNIMAANQLTPVFAAVHNRRGSLFTLGNRARSGLARIAETGDTSALQNDLSGNPNFGAAQTNPFPGDVPLVFAGNTFEFTIEAPSNFRYISLASMILPSNDSFIGLDTASLPVRGSVTYFSPGYDAGSEQNNEICANIPGPTCGGSGEVGDLGGGEGFVHISRGIQGVGDLSSAVYDWRNPTAKIEITRVQ